MRKSDSPDVQIRKFFREVQLSGVLTEAKKRRYREKEPSRRLRRAQARRKSIRNEAKRGW